MAATNLGLLGDSGIAADISKALGGGQSLSHSALITILQDAAAGGITAAEMQSLQQVATWIDGGALSASAYDTYIFDAVVKGNPANATWNGGGTATALGNLAAGASQAQATQLIGKWFLGTDHPGIAGVGYDGTYKLTGNPLFGKYAAPSYLDVNQGSVGDCYLMASLGMVSLLDPGVIQSMITDNSNGTYGIRFVGSNGSPLYVTVDSQLPTYTGNYSWANGSKLMFANGALQWAALIEKAYVQLNAEGILPHTAGNAYSLIAGGWGEPITSLTGKAITTAVPTLQAILTAWNANEEIMVGTGNTTSGNFVSSHMFEVINVNPQTGQVQLHNPWGSAASDANRSMTFWASVSDIQANSGTLIIAQGTTQASLTNGTSTGFANTLADAHFVFSGGHEWMTRPNGTTFDLTAMRLINFTDGTIVKFAASPLVDDLYYNATGLDVWKAHLDATAHYNQYGWKEGRDPNALFSTTGYLAANADVAKAGMNPLTHFDQNGWKEGRDPSAGFDNELYLARNPDVKAAGLDPLAHYLQNGQAEGRQAYAAIGKASDFTHGSFDSEYYLLANPDVAKAALAAGGDTFAFAYQHFEANGWKEGRAADAFFDTAYYLAHNADVAAAHIDPLAHYDQFGWKEGRAASAAFDTKAYLAANPDVAAAHIDPLLHYLEFGALEGRHLV